MAGYLVVSPTVALANGNNASISLAKTVSGANFTPTLTLGLTADPTTAVPGDDVSYSATVTNAGAAMTATGSFTAVSSAEVTGTVVAWYDELQYRDKATNVWVPVAGTSAAAAGYTAVAQPGVSSGLSVSGTPSSANGVVYPSGVDTILGTRIGPHATASWAYTATAQLSATQEALLADPDRAAALRNVVHFEMSPRDPQVGQPYISRVAVPNPFQVGRSTAVGNVSLTFDLPTGPDRVVDASTVARLSSLAAGASVDVPVRYAVPVPAQRHDDESDSAYLQRLRSIDGTTLPARVTASGRDAAGKAVTAGPVQASASEAVPVVTIGKSGPASADAGTAADYALALDNGGSATARTVEVVDALPDGAHGTVTDVPGSLSAGATATARASYAIPANQPDGPLTDTGSVTWSDRNGNDYGPVTATFTTDVHSAYVGATLELSPDVAGPDVVGTRQQLAATLRDRTGQSLPAVTVRFTVVGANEATADLRTDAAGRVTFGYAGTGAGVDTVQATLVTGGLHLQSNTATVGWVAPVQPASTTTVQGRFFVEPPGATTFAAKPSDTPAFSQSFPSLTFNPPTGVVPHQIVSANPATRPFTDVTTDIVGNGVGAIPAEGAGHRAGTGDMACFDAVFTAELVVANASDVTFRFRYGSGFIFGVGGATRVNGLYEDMPNGASTAFEQYPVLGADNRFSNVVGNGTVTVHFPAAGSYPYEVDYTGCGTEQSLVMQTVSFDNDASPLSIYVGYADGLRPGGSVFPYPWAGSPGVSFIGGTSSFYDAGALRFDNTSDTPIDIESAIVDVGSIRTDIWGRHRLVPPHGSLILTQTADYNFDSSDFLASCSPPNGLIPKVYVTIDGVTTAYTDTHQVLNTMGYDVACFGNESHPWERVGGATTGVNHPLPPAASVMLTPVKSVETTVGTELTVGVSVMDASGRPVANNPVGLNVAGANAGTAIASVTDEDGFASFSYVGTADGTDTLQATSFVTGMRSVSNTTNVVWTVPPFVPPSPTPTPSDSVTPTPSDSVTPTPSETVTPSPSESVTPSPSESVTPGPTTTSPTPAPTSPSPSPSPTRVGPPGAPPAIVSPAPADGSRVIAPVPVTATIQPPAGASIASWKVTEVNVDGGAVRTIGSGTGTPPVNLARFDPTVLDNGTYRITVSATGSTGGVQSVATTVSVDGKLKLGRFAATWHDLDATLGSTTLGLMRSYDSTVSRSGDFGYGWSLAVDSVRVSTGRALGNGGWTQYDASCFFGICTTGYRTTTPHVVTVTFPDGHVETFDFTPTGSTLDYWLANAAFTPRAGTTSTLAPVGDTELVDQGDGSLYDENTLEPYAPTRFRLTTRDGQVLLLDVRDGLVGLTDTGGVDYTFSSSGIISTAGGGGARYTRDAQGRITRIDALGSTRYSYDTAGNLASVTDAAGAVTTFTYDGEHDLLEVTGPGSVPLRTMQYDDAGRLTAITDADGNTTHVDSDVAGRTQTVTDPTGRLTTVSTLDDFGDVVRTVQAGGGATRTATYSYDAFGRQLTATDPLGHTTTTTYDAVGNRLSTTDAAGHATRWTYDSQGQVLSKTNAAGGVTSFSYDAHHDLVAVTDLAGHVTSYRYDAAGHPTSMVDANGGATSATYDGGGRLATASDPLGRVTAYAYDGGGRVASKTDAAGRTTGYSYDGDGRPLSVTDALGRVTRRSYDSLGNLATTVDASGGVTRYDRTPGGQLSSVTDPDGRTTTYRYDAAGHKSTQTDAAGGETTYAYDAFGDLTATTDPMGRRSSYGYDSAGRQTEATLPNGATWRFSYDAAHVQTGVTDPLGHTTRSSHDALQRLTDVTDALGHSTHYDYTVEGNLAAVTDANQAVKRYRYDALGNLTAAVDATGQATAYAYDAAGQLTRLTDPTGRSTTYTYLPSGQVGTQTDTAGHVVSFGYDGVDNLASVSLPSGVATSLAYDAANRVTSMVDGLGHRTTHEYDAAGLVTAATDARGNRTTYDYDALGRTTKLTDPLGGAVSLGYNADGEETSVTDADGVTTSYGYNPLGELTSQRDPLGNTKRWSYDDAGRLSVATNSRGQATAYSYDDADQLTGWTSPDGTVTQAFDAVGNRTSLADSAGTTRFDYDADARITKVVEPAGTVSYSYDTAGRRSSTDVNGQHISYTYDDAGRLASMNDPSGTTSFSYDADGRPSSEVRPNGVESSYGYDRAGRLVSLHHDKAGTPLAHFDYTLDAAGNRIAVAGPDGTDRFTVDAAGRLTDTAGPSGTASYAYTKGGNRSSTTSGGTTTAYDYDAAGRLSDAGGTSYGYDADGNLTTAGGDTFGYDAAGHLTSIKRGGASTAAYRYDGDGRRMSSTAGGATTSYLRDEAADNAPVLAAGDHTYGRTPGGQLVSDTTTGGSVFPLADALGSIRAVTGPGGAVVGTAGYDAFGRQTSATGTTTAFGYTGAMSDPGGLVDLNAREYDPGTGRFLQADSYEVGGPGTTGYNRYTYALDNPTSVVDPSGHTGDLAETEVALDVNNTLDASIGLRLAGLRVLAVAISEWLEAYSLEISLAQCAAEYVNDDGEEVEANLNLAMCLFFAWADSLVRMPSGSGYAEIAREHSAVQLEKVTEEIGEDLPHPTVTNDKLRNIVRDLYKGTTNPARIGTGTTMDAVRHEVETGLPTGGRFHEIKAKESVTALSNWLDKNAGAADKDILVAQSLLDDLRAALGFAP